MKEILYFPKLNLKFNLERIAFSVGPVKIYWYGILITIGFILAMVYTSLLSKKKFGLKMENIIDIIIYSVIGGIIGARVYYVIFNFDIYRYNIWDIFKIWQGGIAIYGGIIGAFLVGIIICKKRKIPVLPMLDLAAGGLILGQAIGRWGNFVNIEAFGKNTNLPWGMTSISIQRYLAENMQKLANQGVDINISGNVHPCFFYESVWCFIGFLVILFITINSNYICSGYNSEAIENKSDLDNTAKTKKKKIDLYPGNLVLIYFIWYGFGRSIIEGLRVDSLMIENIRVSRLLSVILVLVSIILLITSRLHRNRKSNRSDITISINTGSAEEILERFADKEE